MRNEYVDMTEFVRRMELGIYDKEEYERALVWTKENCKEGGDVNPPELTRTREQKDQDWETVVKMTLIARDLMIGNPQLDGIGYGEEALGHNAIAAGFQGQRAWTDFSRMVILWRRYCPARSIGMEFGSLMYLPQKMIR